MVKGPIRININRDFVLSKVDAYSIFKYYYPGNFSLNRMCHSPFSVDKHRSCIIGDKQSEITFKCFNSPHRGDCFNFVSNLFNISYTEAIQKVAEDFRLLDTQSTFSQEIAKKFVYTKEEKKPHIIQVKAKPFQQEHIDYLKQYHLEPKDLNFADNIQVYAVKEWFLNGSRMPLKDKEVAFAYNLISEQGNWVKIYRPTGDKKSKWTSNIPFIMTFGLNNMKDSEWGVLTKSVKDAAFIRRYITPHVCVIQAEDITAITEENMKFLKDSCKNLYIGMDCDKKGKEASWAICNEMGVKHINPPDSLLLEGESDFSGMAMKWGIQSVIDHFKLKIYGNNRTE